MSSSSNALLHPHHVKKAAFVFYGTPFIQSTITMSDCESVTKSVLDFLVSLMPQVEENRGQLRTVVVFDIMGVFEIKVFTLQQLALRK